MPARILVFQIEPLHRALDGAVHEHTFRLGCGLVFDLDDGRKTGQAETVFRSREDWWQWISTYRLNRGCTWVFSYGLVYGLTLLNAFRTWDRSGETVVSAVLSDPPSIVTTRRARSVLKFVDVQNYFRDGLVSLMRSGCCQTAISPWLSVSAEEAIARCGEKVNFIGDFLCQAIQMIRSNRLCGWQCTGASLSWAAYRHSFYKSQIAIHGHPGALRLEKNSLYGGRVQMWTSGQVSTPVTILDANSLYPAVMRDYCHPIKLRSYQGNASVSELQQALRGYECVARVRLGAGAPDLPLRCEHGVLWTDRPGIRTLGWTDLRAASAAGSVSKVFALARYESGAPFTSFVDSLFGLKLRYQESGNATLATFTKMLLNSLPGKFGQKGRAWKNDYSVCSPGRWRTWYGAGTESDGVTAYRNLGGVNQRLEVEAWSRDSFPGLLGSITSAAREELRRARDVAGVAETHYCDTDSLHVGTDGHDRMVAADMCHPTSLGKWKILHRGADAHYYALKHYRVGDKGVCNLITASAVGIAEGVYRDAARLTFDRLIQDRLPDAIYYQERVVKIRDSHSAERMEPVGYEEVA